MSKTLRTLAAAALIAAGLPQVASAALVTRTIDFEAVAADTNMTGSSTYNDTAHGHTTFSGSAFSVATEDASFNPTIALWSPCPSPTACQSVSASLTITVADLFHGDNASVGLLLDVGNSQALNFEIRDAGGGLLKAGDFSPPSGPGFRSAPVFIAFSGIAKSITFSGFAEGFLIDNLSFSVDDAVVVTPVPEPASAALVALALVGAASVTRRRKSR